MMSGAAKSLHYHLGLYAHIEEYGKEDKKDED